MNEPIKLRTVRNELSENTAQVLRALADRADTGEITAVTAVVEYSDGRYSIDDSGTLSRLQMIGALFEAMLAKVNR